MAGGRHREATEPAQRAKPSWPVRIASPPGSTSSGIRPGCIWMFTLSRPSSIRATRLWRIQRFSDRSRPRQRPAGSTACLTIDRRSFTSSTRGSIASKTAASSRSKPVMRSASNCSTSPAGTLRPASDPFGRPRVMSDWLTYTPTPRGAEKSSGNLLANRFFAYRMTRGGLLSAKERAAPRAVLGRAHGPRRAEPGGPHDGERGGGHQRARQTGPRRDEAGPRAAFQPRLVPYRRGAFGKRRGKGAVGIADRTGYALAAERPWGVAGGPPGAAAAAAEASEWRPNSPFCCLVLSSGRRASIGKR